MTITEVADAVADTLADFPAQEQFTVERAFRPVRERSELTGLTLTVVPRAIEREIEARGLLRTDLLIDVGLQKVLPEGSEENRIASLVATASAAALALLTRRPALAEGTVCVAADLDPLLDMEHLSSMRLFTSVIKARYRLLESTN